jgi:hypothetical protein
MVCEMIGYDDPKIARYNVVVWSYPFSKTTKNGVV